jgi:hypothetical protein
MSEQMVNLTETSVTGAASNALCNEFLRLIADHPKGEDYVSSKIGVQVVGLMLLVREASMASRASGTPEIMSLVFDYASGLSWMMAFAATIPNNILKSALSVCEIPETMRGDISNLIKIREEESAGIAVIWPIITAYFALDSKSGVHYANALMQEYLVHIPELTA